LGGVLMEHLCWLFLELFVLDMNFKLIISKVRIHRTGFCSILMTRLHHSYQFYFTFILSPCLMDLFLVGSMLFLLNIILLINHFIESLDEFVL
jgi:hypothetical protein